MQTISFKWLPGILLRQLHTRHWEDQEGNRHCATEIVSDEMILLDKHPKNNTFEAKHQD